MLQCTVKEILRGPVRASDHIAQGWTTFATPDGRRTGEPLADAISPSQSRDVNGPTAVFISSGCFDHHHFAGGIALNLRIHPSVLSRPDGVKKLVDMTKTYFERGGMEVQYNVVDTAAPGCSEDPRRIPRSGSAHRRVLGLFC